LVVCLLVLSDRAVALPAVTEHELKAAYLLNVLRFTEGKPGPVAHEFFTLCLIAAGPIEKPLEALGDSLVRGRKLRVLQVGKREELNGCEAVFIGRSAGHQVLLKTANALGALTIGNDLEFIPMSGAVALVVENHRIVVEINRDAISNRNWLISSHLLEIARIRGGNQ